MHNGRLVGIIDGGGDGTGGAAFDLERSLVAGLAARRGIEHGPVERDAAALVDAEHARRAVAQVGVGPIELLGHALMSPIQKSENREASTAGFPSPLRGGVRGGGLL